MTDDASGRLGAEERDPHVRALRDRPAAENASARPTAAEPLEDFRTIGRRVSNWGRWGDDDERGTLNLIGPAQLIDAAGLVRTGKMFALGIPFDDQGPQDGGIRGNPARLMKETGAHPQGFPGAFRYADDYVFMALQSASQWDALAHVHYDGALYNGFPSSSVDFRGAGRCAVTNLSPGVAGRGVLLDVARWRGVDWLDVGTRIGPEDLDEVARAQGVEVRAGDILLVRTGWRRRFLSDLDRRAFRAGEPGLSVRCAEWLRRHDVAAVGSDNFAVEVLPGEYPDEYLPLHMIAIRDMGMPLAEILDLESLAEDCADDGVFEFLFTGPPLSFTGGVGSPVNPLALK
ncbi:MAG: cyclase family protein [Blastococcus sp.]|nr:cyclase family protein [Blastococcus sp.]